VAATRSRMTVDARREQLLDSGAELFAERAYGDVSLDEIAEFCGVSRGLLYHYFDGKRDFYVATVRRASERLRDVEPDPSLDRPEQLRSGLRAYFDAVGANSAAYVTLLGAAAGDPELAEIFDERRRTFAARVVAALPPEDAASPLVETTARAWIGAVEAATLDWVERPGVSSEDLIVVLAESLRAGLAAAAERR
jgi:AcrR family transcriptional regulator